LSWWHRARSGIGVDAKARATRGQRAGDLDGAHDAAEFRPRLDSLDHARIRGGSTKEQWE
jgi:hypothetical protein